MKLNRKETAEFFGVAKTTLDQWRADGCPVESSGGKGVPTIYDTAKVFRWHMEKKSDPSGDYSELLEFEKYRKIKRENDLASGELLLADDVRAAFADMVLTARGKILGIKGRLAPLLKEFIEDRENFGLALETVDDAIRDILTEMAEAKHNSK